MDGETLLDRLAGGGELSFLADDKRSPDGEDDVDEDDEDESEDELLDEDDDDELLLLEEREVARLLEAIMDDDNTGSRETEWGAGFWLPELRLLLFSDCWLTSA